MSLKPGMRPLNCPPPLPPPARCLMPRLPLSPALLLLRLLPWSSLTAKRLVPLFMRWEAGSVDPIVLLGPAAITSQDSGAMYFGNRRRFPYRPDAAPCTFGLDRKSTRLNSSHLGISYAVFCL